MGKVFPDDTGTARLQQIGLFTPIFALEESDVPVTVKRLSKMTGQSPSKVHLQLQELVKVGVVEQKKALNRHGRGQVFYFSIKQTAKAKQLMKAIGKVAVAYKR